MPTGKIVYLSILWPYTVEAIKYIISKKEGIPSHCQQLTFNGRVVEDGRVLAIEDRSNFDLMVCGSEFMS